MKPSNLTVFIKFGLLEASWNTYQSR